MTSFYQPGWRANDSGGETPWADSWTGGSYAQQLRGVGAPDAEYAERYASLTKGDSSVDDDGEWRTVTSLENKKEGTKAEMQRLAAEWQAKGYDVRVQDLDDRHGADWADLAVRKGQGQAQEPTIVQPRESLVKAREAWDKDQTDEFRAQASIPFLPTGDGVGDAADYGNRAGEWYAKNFPSSLDRQALLESEEMGQSGEFNLARFVSQVPKLGDPKQAFDHYADAIG